MALPITFRSSRSLLTTRIHTHPSYTNIGRLASSRCLYHSYDHPSSPPYPPTETAILSAALSHVPDHGFTEKSLVQGAKDAGYLPVSLNLLPRGVFELVMYYLISRRAALKDVVEGEGGLKRVWEERKIGVGGRVRGLLIERLRMNERMGVVGSWQQACFHTPQYHMGKGKGT